MKKIKTVKEAFSKDGLDPEQIKIEGVPERHVEAVKAFAKLCVIHDAVNPKFQPDYENFSQYKYENWFRIGSPSGVGFSCHGCDGWYSLSTVGARLASESSDAAEHIAEQFPELYKAMMVYEREIK